MLRTLKKFIHKEDTSEGLSKELINSLYNHIVEKSRQDYFYADIGVPDTKDGRFDMISFHMALFMHRLQEEQYEQEKAQKLSQKLFDRMFVDMDMAMREMGVGDLAVPHKMKHLMARFNGQAHGIVKGLQDDSLAQFLKKNLDSAGEHINADKIDDLARYYREFAASLEETSFETLTKEGLPV